MPDRRYRATVTQVGVGIVDRYEFAAADDDRARSIAGDMWNGRWSTAEAGRYKLRTYRDGERKPIDTIG